MKIEKLARKGDRFNRALKIAQDIAVWRGDERDKAEEFLGLWNATPREPHFDRIERIEVRVARWAKTFFEKVDPQTAVRSGMPWRWAFEAIERNRPDPILDAAIRAWRDAAYQEEKDEATRWLWREEIPRALQAGPGKDGAFTYRSRPTQKFPSCNNFPSRMGKLWARERALFSEEEARQIEERLASLGPAGQAILAAAAGHDDEEAVAEMYGYSSDGQVFFQDADGQWHSPRSAAEIVAQARPWTRADLMAQWERHAKMNDLARQWLTQLKVYVGEMGQGHLVDAIASAPRAAAVVDRLEPLADAICKWVAQQLKVPAPPAPKVLPLPPDVAARYPLMVRGMHVEDNPDCIYLSVHADRETLAHECVHYVLTHSGRPEHLTPAAEEALAESIAARLPRLLPVAASIKTGNCNDYPKSC